MHDIIAVVGAGTMGTGIARVAVLAGHPALPLDAAPGPVLPPQSAADSAAQRR